MSTLDSMKSDYNPTLYRSVCMLPAQSSSFAASVSKEYTTEWLSNDCTLMICIQSCTQSCIQPAYADELIPK